MLHFIVWLCLLFTIYKYIRVYFDENKNNFSSDGDARVSCTTAYFYGIWWAHRLLFANPYLWLTDEIQSYLMGFVHNIKQFSLSANGNKIFGYNIINFISTI